MNDTTYNLALDRLRGAHAIAKFLGCHKRRVYYMAERKQFPHSHEGGVICARKSILLRWIKEQEESNCGGEDESSD